MRISPKITSFQALTPQLATQLESWYLAHQRDLPWRISRDPYRIWLSEIMLQQTMVQAVIPYFERFLKRFPTVQALASAKVEDVQEQWSGLGYYSRARNLHKAAQAILREGFPKTAAALQELPGFGPYTSRAVSSQAFGEKVGVLDGNVIRVLSRMTGWSCEWWKPAERAQLQTAADALAQHGNPSHLNQGLMELGATICTPQSPACLLCPWNAKCVAFAKHTQSELPLKKPRRETEIWIWRPQVWQRQQKIGLVENSYAPFLKKHLIFPGEAKRVTRKPKEYAFTHGITHHQIFVQLPEKSSRITGKDISWLPLAELSRRAPSILLRKVLQAKQILPLLIFTVALFFAKMTVAAPSEIAAEIPRTTEIGTAISDSPGQLQDLSRDGTRILYLALTKTQPQHLQLYQFELPNWRERRITYSDGTVTSAVWVSENEVLYTSNTDHRKEQPEAWWGTSVPPNPENDVYRSDSSGLKIERLSKTAAQNSDLQKVSSKPEEWGLREIVGTKFQLLQSTNSHTWQPTQAPKGAEAAHVLRWYREPAPASAWALLEDAPNAPRQIWWQEGHGVWKILTSPEQGVWISIWPLADVPGDHLVLRQNTLSQEYEVWRLHTARMCAQKVLSTKIILHQVMGSVEAKRLIFETQIKTDTQIWARSWRPEDTVLAAGKDAPCDGQTWTLAPVPKPDL